MDHPIPEVVNEASIIIDGGFFGLLFDTTRTNNLFIAIERLPVGVGIANYPTGPCERVILWSKRFSGHSRRKGPRFERPGVAVPKRRLNLMTLIVIKDKTVDLEVAATVATALCAAGVTQSFPGGLAFRLIDDYGGSIEINCDKGESTLAKAAFVAVGFSVLR
jgi:hypothetical protein